MVNGEPGQRKEENQGVEKEWKVGFIGNIALNVGNTGFSGVRMLAPYCAYVYRVETFQLISGLEFFF